MAGEHPLDPRVERRLAGHDPGHGHDTGGVPWHGRELSDNPFSQDTGAVDPALEAALRDGVDDEVFVRVLARARVFVPVVAAPGEGAEAGTDSVADMATVVLTSPDGQRALPVFSSLQTLAGWDPQARPVPVTSETAAQAAVQESCEVLLLDLGDDRARVLRPSMVYALAQRRDWVPADRDVVVTESVSAVRRSVLTGQGRPVVTDVRVAGLTPSGELRVEVVVVPGLDRASLHAVLTEVGGLLSQDAELRARIDGVTLAVAAAPDRTA